MSADEPFTPQDEAYAALLAAWDAELARGSPAPAPESLEIPRELEPRLRRGLACLQRLERVWPRQPADAGPAPPPDKTFAAPGDADAADSSGVGTDPIPGREAAPARLPGRGRIPGYEILGELGRGGMGVVYRARQLALNRMVALKMIRAGAQASPGERARFRAEAAAVARLQHPNIVQIHEVGEHDGGPYFSLELIEGGSLAERCAGTPQLPAQTAALVETLARAMHYAHQQGILHRDLKPANILLSRLQIADCRLQIEQKTPGSSSQSAICDLQSAIPKITDFGLAKRLESEGGQTGTGVILGTAEYMAPEQAAGDGKELGPTADVYGLGAILYALLTGRPPFQGAMPLDTLQLVQTAEPVPPSHLALKCPRDLETICLKCLRKEPHKRYASALELADDLQRFQGGQPIRARPVGPLERALKWTRRRPAAALAVGALLAAVLAVGGGGYRAAQQRAVRQAETLRIVNPLLEQARQRQGEALAASVGDLAAWDAALQAAQLAHDALEAGAGDADTGRRLDELLAELAAGRAAARQAAARARQDRQMGRTLEDIRLRRTGSKDSRWDYEWVASEYAAAFRGYGIDVAQREAGAAAAIQSRAIQAELVAALDDWILVSKWGGADCRGPLAVVQEADPDPQRHRLREAVLRADREALVRLAVSVEALGWSPATLDLLGASLAGLGKRAEAVALLRRARQRYPADLWINVRLANLLMGGTFPERQEALRYCMTALTLRGTSSLVWLTFGNALDNRGLWDEAGAAFHEALRLRKDYPEAHYNLGSVLFKKGQLDEASAEIREAIRLRKDWYAAHHHLGNVLYKKGPLDEAIACYRQALRFRPDFPKGHNDLGNALSRKGQWDEAIACYRAALRLRPNYADAHYNLGHSLQHQSHLDEAMTEYRRAIALKPDLAQARCNLGLALNERGRFAEAVAELRRGHALGSRQPGWQYPSAQWVRQAERLAELDNKLPSFRQGVYQPRDNEERLSLARVCRTRKLYLAAARLSAAAFAAEAGRAEDLRAGHRYNAACCAARAAAGQGEDAAGLSEPERGRWRRQAVAWLRADLALWTKRLASGRAEDRSTLAQALRNWLVDADLVGLRGAAPLDQLPADERALCQQLWADVASLLRQAVGTRSPMHPPGS